MGAMNIKKNPIRLKDQNLTLKPVMQTSSNRSKTINLYDIIMQYWNKPLFSMYKGMSGVVKKKKKRNLTYTSLLPETHHLHNT